ncbi:MAG: hypothetical protein ING44_20015 [Telmatospirillum sp.]|nr:hypothetical protein [Telmatospirillum sp.]
MAIAVSAGEVGFNSLQRTIDAHSGSDKSSQKRLFCLQIVSLLCKPNVKSEKARPHMGGTKLA